VAVCCESRVFELGETAGQVVRPEDCWLCGHCVAVCPVDAIHHSAYPLEDCPTIETLPSHEKLVMALRERRSLRVFRDKPVPRETVRQLVDVSRWAPSASNAQAVDWIAVDDPTQIARLSAEVVATLGSLARLLQNRPLRPLLVLALGRDRAEDAVESADDFQRLAQAHARGADPIFHHAPVVLVAHVPRGTYFGRDDAVYAAYNLMLAAERLGLGTCHIGYLNAALERNRDLPRMLGLPAERQIEVALTLGYPRFQFRRAVPRRQMELVWNPAATDPHLPRIQERGTVAKDR
jgi:nitroreductase